MSVSLPVLFGCNGMELEEDYEEGVDPEEYPPGFSRSTVFPGTNRPLRWEVDGLVESVVSFDGVAGFLGDSEVESEDSEWRMVENLIMGELGLDALLEEDMVTSDHEEEEEDGGVVENDNNVDVEKLGLEDFKCGGCCFICMNEVEEGEVLKKLPCGHYFHDVCILSWLKRKSNCPLCRFELPTCDHDQKRHASTS